MNKRDVISMFQDKLDYDLGGTASLFTISRECVEDILKVLDPNYMEPKEPKFFVYYETKFGDDKWTINRWNAPSKESAIREFKNMSKMPDSFRRIVILETME